MSSSEKTRNLMLKNASSSSSSFSSQAPSNLVNINVFKGTTTSSDFDNSIIVTCPGVPEDRHEKSQSSIKPPENIRSRKVTPSNIAGNNTTVFIPNVDNIANNPFIVTCPSIY
ncbi:unnamed protein product [Caenorhabditis angaria]|uniref:Uncharacterized protein n=1 Tax=Caenorhabditis angaria TaxID=860376 RepID=A0A9P1N6L7_9PELO|nr:unnamed protein product [Caenorhabditis angaria]